MTRLNDAGDTHYSSINVLRLFSQQPVSYSMKIIGYWLTVHTQSIKQQGVNKYKYTTDQELQTELLRGSRWMPSRCTHQMAAVFCMKLHTADILKIYVKSNFYSMHFYSKNIPTKFHPDWVWNDGALGFLWTGFPSKNKTNNNKMSSDMRSVSDPTVLLK